MKKVTPYKRSANAMKALDNGGRFYNLFTKAGDAEVTGAELSKAAGVLGDRSRQLLYLAMAIHDLDEAGRRRVIRSLSSKLKAAYEEQAPQELAPSRVESDGRVPGTAIVTGVPRFLGDKTVHSGFMMIPIQAGKVTTYMWVPFMDQYDLYELADRTGSGKVLLANVRGAKRLPEESTRFGGALKRSSRDAQGQREGELILEPAYYTPLGSR